MTDAKKITSRVPNGELAIIRVDRYTSRVLINGRTVGHLVHGQVRIEESRTTGYWFEDGNVGGATAPMSRAEALLLLMRMAFHE